MLALQSQELPLQDNSTEQTDDCTIINVTFLQSLNAGRSVAHLPIPLLWVIPVHQPQASCIEPGLAIRRRPGDKTNSMRSASPYQLRGAGILSPDSISPDSSSSLSFSGEPQESPDGPCFPPLERRLAWEQGSVEWCGYGLGPSPVRLG